MDRLCPCDGRYARASIGRRRVARCTRGHVDLSCSQGYRAVGDVVDKVGVSTGWNRGPVRETCTHADLPAGFTLLCRPYVGATRRAGDSGSPAFSANVESHDKVLCGLVWGGLRNYTRFGYSDTRLIQAELGTTYIHPQPLDPDTRVGMARTAGTAGPREACTLARSWWRVTGRSPSG